MTALLTHLWCMFAGGCCWHPLASDEIGDDEVGHLLAVSCCRCERTTWADDGEIPRPHGDCARVKVPESISA